jgi:hypothetical protein
MRNTQRWVIYAVSAVAFVTIGVPISQLVLRASLGIIAMVLAGGIALAFMAVAAIVLYMVVQVVADKLRGW